MTSRSADSHRRARASPHDAKGCLVDLEADALCGIVAFGVDDELHEHQCRHLGSEHRSDGAGDRVDRQSGPRGDAGTGEVDHVVGGAPPAGFPARNKAEGRGQDAHPLRVSPVQSRDGCVEGIEESAEPRIALLRCGAGADDEAHVADRIGNGSRSGTIPLRCARNDVARRIEQRRSKGQLGDVGDGEVDLASSIGLAVTVTLSRYLRLPWLTRRTPESCSRNHSPNLRTALVDVSEWKVTMSG